MYHFHAQVINGDPREVSKFVYSHFIKMFINAHVGISNDEGSTFIGPMLVSRHTVTFTATEINKFLDPINLFLTNYF